MIIIGRDKNIFDLQLLHSFLQLKNKTKYLQTRSLLKENYKLQKEGGGLKPVWRRSFSRESRVLSSFFRVPDCSQDTEAIRTCCWVDRLRGCMPSPANKHYCCSHSLQNVHLCILRTQSIPLRMWIPMKGRFMFRLMKSSALSLMKFDQTKCLWRSTFSFAIGKAAGAPVNDNTWCFDAGNLQNVTPWKGIATI